MRIARMLLLLAASLPAIGLRAAPRLVCEAPEFDFGVVRDTQTVTHVFSIRNDGDATLELQPPRASCGCTAVSAGTLSLKAGEATTLQATIDLKGRTGPQHKTVTLYSNDPQSPKVILGLQLDIWQEFRFLPPQLMLGQLRGDAGVQTSAMFENNSVRLVNVTNLSCNNTNLDVRLQTEQAGRRYRVTVGTRPPLVDGPLTAEIQLQTDDPAHREFVLNYACHVRGLLVVTPPSLVIEASETNASTKSFVISPGMESSFKLVRIETPDPSISATWQPYAVPGSYRVVVSNVSYRESLRGRSIKVVTDLTSIQNVLVPIRLEEAPAP